MNKLKPFFCIMILILASGIKPGFSEDKDTVVAKGQDFVMTREFVRGIEEHYSKKGHHAKWEFLVDAALRVKLFAHEELSALSPEEPPDVERHGADYTSRMVKLSEDYAFRLISGYPVDDKTILSFYRSYPEKFLLERHPHENPFQVARIDQPLDPAKIAPLDDKLAGLIRLRIAANNRREIVHEELERLKDKYRIEISK